MAALLAVSVSLMLTGTAYAQVTTLDSAQYDQDDNVLTLNFTGKINPFAVDMTKITIADEPCAITLTHEEYGAVTRDRLSFTIHPSEAHREELSKMRNPLVRAHSGAFATHIDSIVLAPSDAPLSITGSIPEDVAPCVITYGFNDPLLRVYARNYTQTLQAIHDGFEAWAELNPDLSFARVEENPLIWISWEEYNPGHIGRACLDCLSLGATMDIILYDYNCRNERIYYISNSTRNTIAHELGHILGLEHHTNQTHLMHGDDYVEDPFRTLGYMVPELLPGGFIGEQNMTDRYWELNALLNGTKATLDKLGDRIDRYADRHAVKRDGNTIYFETDSQVNRYKSMLREYNALVAEYEASRDEHNELAGEINCLYESPPRG